MLDWAIVQGPNILYLKTAFEVTLRATNDLLCDYPRPLRGHRYSENVRERRSHYEQRNRWLAEAGGCLGDEDFGSYSVPVDGGSPCRLANRGLGFGHGVALSPTGPGSGGGRESRQCGRGDGRREAAQRFLLSERGRVITTAVEMISV